MPNFVKFLMRRDARAFKEFRIRTRTDTHSDMGKSKNSSANSNLEKYRTSFPTMSVLVRSVSGKNELEIRIQFSEP